MGKRLADKQCVAQALHFLQDVKMQPEKHGITEAAHLLGIINLYDAFIARFEALNK